MCRLIDPLKTVALAVMLQAPALVAQQVVDLDYRPRIRVPSFTAAGPLVGIDASHNNPRLSGELSGLARLLEADGYRLQELSLGIDSAALSRISVLVIVDALADRNVDDWTLPTPSALDSSAVRAVVDWVFRGGALLLVADHMPFAGAASQLVDALEVEALNGFAIDTTSWDPIVFRRSDGTLRGHSISDGRGPDEQIDSLFTYWGHAFRPSQSGYRSLLAFREGTASFQPASAWRFVDDTEVLDVEGWSQGIAGRWGHGRLVILGDSGMLMAHRVGPDRQPIGLNAPRAGQNEQFMLNVFHWLTGLLG